MLSKALAFAAVASASAFVAPAGFTAQPKLRAAASGMTMMAEDASRRQFVEGAAVAGAAVTVLPQGASAKAVKGTTESKGFVDPRTYGKSQFKTPYIGIFDQRGDCSRTSKEYTGLPAGNENDDMCVVVKYKSVPTNIDAAKAIFTAFGTGR